METTKPTRDLGVDLLKTLAIFGVLIIHISSAGYANPILSFPWLSSVFWGSITRASVPIFFMCSGVLLLRPEKELSIRRLFQKNLLKIVFAMFVWAFGYKIYHLFAAGKLSLPHIFQAFKEVLVFNHEFHFYFLHIMIIVYVFLPITRVFVKHASRNEMRYGLAVWFLLGIVYPTVKPFWPFNLLSGMPVQWMLNMTYAAIGYGLLGHYLSRYPFSVKRGFLFLAAGFLCVFGGTVWMSAYKGSLYQNFWEGMSVGVALLAVGLFALCRHPKNSLGGKTAAVITKLSKASFCIYLVHVFWLYMFHYLGISVQAFPPLLSIPLIALCNMALSFGVFFVLSKIPFVRTWMI